MYRAVRTAI